MNNDLKDTQSRVNDTILATAFQLRESETWHFTYKISPCQYCCMIGCNACGHKGFFE